MSQKQAKELRRLLKDCLLVEGFLALPPQVAGAKPVRRAYEVAAKRYRDQHDREVDRAVEKEKAARAALIQPRSGQ